MAPGDVFFCRWGHRSHAGGTPPLLRRQVVEDLVASQKTKREGIIVIGEGRSSRRCQSSLAQPIPQLGILGLEKLIGPPTAEANGRPARRDETPLPKNSDYVAPKLPHLLPKDLPGALSRLPDDEFKKLFGAFSEELRRRKLIPEQAPEPSGTPARPRSQTERQLDAVLGRDAVDGVIESPAEGSKKPGVAAVYLQR